jgi:hypothetical protein
MFIRRSPVEMQTPIHWNLIGCNMTAPPPVIAQQYSSAYIVSEHLHSRKEKLSAHFRTDIIIIIIIITF